MWNVIERVKKDRVIILTTHAMEEAEILCDRIAIVHQGKLESLGSSFHLKKKHSKGFRIILYYKDQSEEVVLNLFDKFFPNSKIVAKYLDSVEYIVSVVNLLLLLLFYYFIFFIFFILLFKIFYFYFYFYFIFNMNKKNNEEWK